MNHAAFNNYVDFVHYYLVKKNEMTPEQLNKILKSFISKIVYPEGDFNVFIASCNFEDEEIESEDIFQVQKKMKDNHLHYDYQKLNSYKEITSIVDLESDHVFKKLYMSNSKIDSLDSETLRMEISNRIRLTISLIHWSFIFIPNQVNQVRFGILNHFEKDNSIKFSNNDENEEFELADFRSKKLKLVQKSFNLKAKYKSKQTKIKETIIELDKQLTILCEDFVIGDFIEILFSDDFTSFKDIRFSINNSQVSCLFDILGDYFNGAILSTMEDSNKFLSKSSGISLKSKNIHSAKNKSNFNVKEQEVFKNFKKSLQEIG
ncbi:hypothetical protein [Fluviicola taffensis]|uniref:Uncharacterized protein n=1 Tax=Fluviicola taffensis (strain DSM 16823 / NCIMB 13979 / RW262) TaxID=755732 RepID=F2IEY4_FLUTR|nr:hypothetical protein [Fluviicola taffensis]AEA42449.1 hypothetical protein Fluta_0443 [Fluviicola taffensis DSM 16823]